jgi:transcriptional regulator with XRE-family HTH domain
MRPDEILRAVRHLRRLSQRELAEQAGVPRSTVDRIESGRTRDPALATIDQILNSVGLHLAIHDADNRELRIDGDRFRVWDRAGRRFPAHLPVRKITSMQDDWWGWFRIAWLPDSPKLNPIVPYYTYDRRPCKRVRAKLMAIRAEREALIARQEQAKAAGAADPVALPAFADERPVRQRDEDQKYDGRTQ